MKKILHPFQHTGAQFLASNYHALLADEPGLGKTVQAIAAAELLNLRRNLVVCPASVRSNWWQEIGECTGKTGNWQIISYNQASKKDLATLRDLDLIVLDEVHFLKTPDSQRTQAIFGKHGLARRAKYKWALSGTPVPNRPREFYPLLKSLAAKQIAPFDNFTAYAYRYCGAYYDGYGLNAKGASRLDELAGRLSGFMLRRTKLEVMKELPPKIIQRVPLGLTAADLAAVSEVESEIEDREAFISAAHEGYAQLGDLARLLRVTGEAKVRAAVAFIDELADAVEGKLVVFARHRAVIARLATALREKNRGVVTYVGGMTDGEKTAAINTFVQDPNCGIFIGNIQAAGTGINGLQYVANDVVFAELSWVPGEMGQAMDRVDRMGKKFAGPINAYLLHAPGTLESAVLNVHDGKVRVIDRLLGDPLEGLV